VLKLLVLFFGEEAWIWEGLEMLPIRHISRIMVGNPQNCLLFVVVFFCSSISFFPWRARGHLYLNVIMDLLAFLIPLKLEYLRREE